MAGMTASEARDSLRHIAGRSGTMIPWDLFARLFVYFEVFMKPDDYTALSEDDRCTFLLLLAEQIEV